MIASDISFHLFLYNSYSFSKYFSLSSFDVNPQFENAFLAAVTAKCTSSLSPTEITAQAFSVDGSITSKSF